MKDIFEAIESRIKSPVFGYFVLSMLAVNWKPFFFLLFDDSSVTSRFAYFDLHSSYITLLVYPALLAALYSIIYPWIQYIFIWISSKPAHLKNLHNINAEHKQLIEHQKLERLRNEKKKEDELEAIERAKRDQKIVEEITDEGTREKVQSEIKNIRQDRNSSTGNAKTFQPSKEQLEILKVMTMHGGEILKSEIIAKALYEKVKTEYFLETLVEEGFIKEDWSGNLGGPAIFLTTKSKKLMVEAGVV